MKVIKIIHLLKTVDTPRPTLKVEEVLKNKSQGNHLKINNNNKKTY